MEGQDTRALEQQVNHEKAIAQSAVVTGGPVYFEEEWEDLSNLDKDPCQFTMTAPCGYHSLAQVFQAAIDQAANGKGKERHANEMEPFEMQKICELTRRIGLGGPAFQVCKKTQEAQRMGGEGGKADILGAMVYLGAMYLVMEEGQ